MLRRYDYEARYLPHIQKDNRASSSPSPPISAGVSPTSPGTCPGSVHSCPQQEMHPACGRGHARPCPPNPHAPWPTSMAPFSIPQIMHAIKSESAHRINKATQSAEARSGRMSLRSRAPGRREPCAEQAYMYWRTRFERVGEEPRRISMALAAAGDPYFQTA